MEIKIEKYQGYNLYTYDNKYFEILKKAMNNEFEVQAEYKNNNRTYVAKILLEGKVYIFKRFFFKKITKKFLSFFRRGEALETLKNITSLKEKGFYELSSIFGAGILRKNNFIEEQFMLMEFEEGTIVHDYNLIEGFLKKLHKVGRFHGDPNLGNFIMGKNNEIRVIDTQVKKMYCGNYRAHYDIMSLKQHFLETSPYPYKKNIFFYQSFIERKLRGRKIRGI